MRRRDEQVYAVIVALPYICTYKAQYMKELRYFIGEVFKDIIEEHTIDVEENVMEERLVA